ncbi:MAG TPA: GNAT family N-acetyltransferase [Microvirga sp.]|nr:GNAT family N-acetyltransferase [Microvirga sp.]
MPTILAMTARLHEAAGISIPLHAPSTAAFVAALLRSPDGLVLIQEMGGRPVGMLVASIGTSSISPARIAVEHGWWVDPDARGGGSRLLAQYERWARERGCFAVRMSTPDVSGPAVILKRKGYQQAEVAWSKVLG